MAKSPILAVQLNASETAMLMEAVGHQKSVRDLVSQVGVSYVKRTSHPVWQSNSPFYEHFSNAMTAVILKANPNYSNPRELVKYARECGRDWYIAEGDASLKAARDAAEAAKAEAKAKEAEVAAAKAEANREDITVSEQKLAKAKAKEIEQAHKALKATANTKATEYAVAYEAKFPRQVTLLSKQDKLDEFVKSVKALKAKFENLEDGSVDKYVHDATTAYLEKMKRWTEVAPAATPAK
jgi:hypothetical protein